MLEQAAAAAKPAARLKALGRVSLRHNTEPMFHRLLLPSNGCQSTQSSEVTEEVAMKMLTVQLKSAVQRFIYLFIFYFFCY